MHDASSKNLEEAVAMMNTYQVSKKLSDDEVKDVAEFLKSLTGQYNGKTLSN